MDNYQLVVPAAHESIDDDDDDDRRHGGEPSYSGKSRSLTTRSDPPSTPRRRRYHPRTDSRGSYSSIFSDSDNRRYGDGESTIMDHDTMEDDTRPALFYMDDGEKSPLHRSFEDMEEDDNHHNDDDEKNQMEATSKSTRPGTYPPNRTTASILFGSDDSDDEDEYEEHLKRYALDFRRSSSLSNNNSNSNDNNNNSYSLWSKMQEARQRARQRRTEYLLEQSERRSWKQSLYLFLVTTLCDATDGGIALIAIGLLAWFLMVWKLPEHRSLIFWSGLVVWSIRFGARPARHYWIQRRIRLYQQQQHDQWRHHYSGGGEFRQDGTVPDTPPPLSPPPTVNRFEDATPRTTTTSSGGAFFPLAMPSSMELSAV